MDFRKVFLTALAVVALACTGGKSPEEEPGDDPGTEVVPVDPDPDPDPDPDSDPYADLEGLVIRTAEDLRAFLAKAQEEEKVHLVNDVDLEGESVSASSFSGIFDGREHTIANPGAPLFKSNSGTIQNLTVTGG